MVDVTARSAGGRIFSDSIEEWGEKLAKVCIEDDPLEVRAIPDGIVLPIRKRELTEPQSKGVFDGIFEGGVVTPEYEFAGGCIRDATKPLRNYACVQGYHPDSAPARREEEVVFGGILYGHYGHMLTDGLARMWWYAENPDTPLKIVFAIMPGESAENAKRLFDLAGLAEDRYEIIAEPTQFAQVIVPDEAVYTLQGRVNGKWLLFYDLLVERSLAQSRVEVPSKVYFTRTGYSKQDGIGEEYYERFFEQQGYAIVSPERYSLPDQIAMYAKADAIACTLGTLSHAAIFARPGTELTCLLRCCSTVMQQLMVNEVRALNWMMFDAHLNVLPTIQGCGAYLYGPTRHFGRYLKAKALPMVYSEEERERVLREHLYDYLLLWRDTFMEPRAFRAIFKRDMVDLLKALGHLDESGPYDMQGMVVYDKICRRSLESALRAEKRTMRNRVWAFAKRHLKR